MDKTDVVTVPGLITRASSRANLRLLIQLRWIAVVGQIVTIGVVHAVMGIALPLMPMLALIGVLIVFNLISLRHWRHGKAIGQNGLFVALLLDVAVLTLQLYHSGGAVSPFIFLYLLQVSLGAALLDARHTWALFAVAVACFVALMIDARPLPVSLTLAELSPRNIYLLGLLICFVLNAALLIIFVSGIRRNERQRDEQLALARQRQAEEAHIVRMGLLATGAAHELSTPLATVAVILGDWRRIAPIANEPELLADIDEMQNQVARCKGIVSGILMSAGETRGELPEKTTLQAFLAELTQRWRATRPVARFDFKDETGSATPIVADPAIAQMIDNVLDNALEASPEWVGLTATVAAGVLTIAVSDRGPGFSPTMLDQIGTPYLSGKTRPGSGLGLFLALNVARRLGGSITAANRPEGGAVVTLTLPIAAIMLESSTPSEPLS